MKKKNGKTKAFVSRRLVSVVFLCFLTFSFIPIFCVDVDVALESIEKEWNKPYYSLSQLIKVKDEFMTREQQRKFDDLQYKIEQYMWQNMTKITAKDWQNLRVLKAPIGGMDAGAQALTSASGGQPTFLELFMGVMPQLQQSGLQIQLPAGISPGMGGTPSPEMLSKVEKETGVEDVSSEKLPPFPSNSPVQYQEQVKQLLVDVRYLLNRVSKFKLRADSGKRLKEYSQAVDSLVKAVKGIDLLHKYSLENEFDIDPRDVKNISDKTVADAAKLCESAARVLVWSPIAQTLRRLITFGFAGRGDLGFERVFGKDETGAYKKFAELGNALHGDEPGGTHTYRFMDQNLRGVLDERLSLAERHIKGVKIPATLAGIKRKFKQKVFVVEGAREFNKYLSKKIDDKAKEKWLDFSDAEAKEVGDILVAISRFLVRSAMASEESGRIELFSDSPDVEFLPLQAALFEALERSDLIKQIESKVRKNIWQNLADAAAASTDHKFALRGEFWEAFGKAYEKGLRDQESSEEEYENISVTMGDFIEPGLKIFTLKDCSVVEEGIDGLCSKLVKFGKVITDAQESDDYMPFPGVSHLISSLVLRAKVNMRWTKLATQSVRVFRRKLITSAASLLRIITLWQLEPFFGPEAFNYLKDSQCYAAVARLLNLVSGRLGEWGDISQASDVTYGMKFLVDNYLSKDAVKALDKRSTAAGKAEKFSTLYAQADFAAHLLRDVSEQEVLAIYAALVASGAVPPPVAPAAVVGAAPFPGTGPGLAHPGTGLGLVPPAKKTSGVAAVTHLLSSFYPSKMINPAVEGGEILGSSTGLLNIVRHPWPDDRGTGDFFGITPAGNQYVNVRAPIETLLSRPELIASLQNITYRARLWQALKNLEERCYDHAESHLFFTKFQQAFETAIQPDKEIRAHLSDVVWVSQFRPADESYEISNLIMPGIKLFSNPAAPAVPAPAVPAPNWEKPSGQVLIREGMEALAFVVRDVACKLYKADAAKDQEKPWNRRVPVFQGVINLLGELLQRSIDAMDFGQGGTISDNACYEAFAKLFNLVQGTFDGAIIQGLIDGADANTRKTNFEKGLELLQRRLGSDVMAKVKEYALKANDRVGVGQFFGVAQATPAAQVAANVDGALIGMADPLGNRLGDGAADGPVPSARNTTNIPVAFDDIFNHDDEDLDVNPDGRNIDNIYFSVKQLVGLYQQPGSHLCGLYALFHALCLLKDWVPSRSSFDSYFATEGARGADFNSGDLWGFVDRNLIPPLKDNENVCVIDDSAAFASSASQNFNNWDVLRAIRANTSLTKTILKFRKGEPVSVVVLNAVGHWVAASFTPPTPEGLAADQNARTVVKVINSHLTNLRDDNALKILVWIMRQANIVHPVDPAEVRSHPWLLELTSAEKLFGKLETLMQEALASSQGQITSTENKKKAKDVITAVKAWKATLKQYPNATAEQRAKFLNHVLLNENSLAPVGEPAQSIQTAVTALQGAHGANTKLTAANGITSAGGQIRNLLETQRDIALVNNVDGVWAMAAVTNADINDMRNTFAAKRRLLQVR